MRTLSLIVGAALFLMAGNAFGQTCRPAYSSYSPGVVHAPTYYQPAPVEYHAPAKTVVVEVVKEVPVAYTVLVPAFQFQYSPPCYAAPPVPVQGAYPAAPVAAPTPGGYGPTAAQAPGYGSQAPGQPPVSQAPVATPPPQQDKIKELAAALLIEMRRQAEQDVNDDGPPAVSDGTAPVQAAPPASPPQAAPPASPPQAAPPASPPVGGGTVATKEQWQPYALNALSRACAQCHTGQGAKGEVVIFNQPGVFNPGAPMGTMLKEINAGRMPPPSYNYRLTTAELEALRIWLPVAK